jgi:hypothetical protein
VPLTLYINHRFLPKVARPGRLCTLMVGIGSIVYITFSISCIVWEIGRIGG